MLLVALSLAGCTEWVKPGVSPQLRDRDLAACTSNSYREAFVDQIVVQEPGYHTPGREVCEQRKGREECTYTPGYWTGPSERAVDANREWRDSLIADCMLQRGYYQQ
ncbi:hypothetical protein [Dyella sp. 2RAB6]|uniref:hypothetical protein n=1 Tax=Dyella sp. 2RAB6 TaxID=3232992 RepID=UPI003F92B7A8